MCLLSLLKNVLSTVIFFINKIINLLKIKLLFCFEVLRATHYAVNSKVRTRYFRAVRTGVRQGGYPPPSPILADWLTLSQSERANYAHHITTCPFPTGFLDLPTALVF